MGVTGLHHASDTDARKNVPAQIDTHLFPDRVEVPQDGGLSYYSEALRMEASHNSIQVLKAVGPKYGFLLNHIQAAELAQGTEGEFFHKAYDALVAELGQQGADNVLSLAQEQFDAFWADERDNLYAGSYETDMTRRQEMVKAFKADYGDVFGPIMLMLTSQGVPGGGLAWELAAAAPIAVAAPRAMPGGRRPLMPQIETRRDLSQHTMVKRHDPHTKSDHYAIKPKSARFDGQVPARSEIMKVLSQVELSKADQALLSTSANNPKFSHIFDLFTTNIHRHQTVQQVEQAIGKRHSWDRFNADNAVVPLEVRVQALLKVIKYEQVIEGLSSSNRPDHNHLRNQINEINYNLGSVSRMAESFESLHQRTSYIPETSYRQPRLDDLRRQAVSDFSLSYARNLYLSMGLTPKSVWEAKDHSFRYNNVTSYVYHIQQVKGPSEVTNIDLITQ